MSSNDPQDAGPTCDPAKDAVFSAEDAGDLGPCDVDGCGVEATILIVKPWSDDDITLCAEHAREEGAIV